MSDSPPRAFFDTSVLIYGLSEGDPRAATVEALLTVGGCLSVQVLNEFASVARRKLKMPWPEIQEALAAIRALCEPPLPIRLQTHEAALGLAARYGYTLYDALILAAALESGCDVLYTEDMQDGQQIESLTLRNPFA